MKTIIFIMALLLLGCPAYAVNGVALQDKNGNAISSTNPVPVTFGSGAQHIAGSLTVDGGIYGSGGASIGGWTTGTNKVYTTNSGDSVGIGTSSPAGILDISGSSNSTDLTTFISSRSFSIINADTTNNNANGVAFRTLDNSGTLTTGAKFDAVYTSHGSNTVSADIAILTRNSGTISEKARILSNGNVGIGSTSPSQKLDVSGNMQVSGAGTFIAGTGIGIGTTIPQTALEVIGTAKATNLSINTVSPTAKISVMNSGAESLMKLGNVTPGDAVTVLANGNVGIATITPSSSLEVDGSVYVYPGTTTNPTALFVKGGINNYLEVNVQNTSTGASASSDIVATTSNGTATSGYVNFGVNGQNGTSSPFTTPRDGYMYSSDSTLNIGAFGSGSVLAFSVTPSITATGEVMRIIQGGNVGIGTISPAATLDVESVASKPIAKFGIAGSSSVVIDTNGNVGIGSSAPVAKVQVSGTIRASTFTTDSSANYTGTSLDATILKNASSSNNATINLTTNGSGITRNINDANPVLYVQQINGSATGDIMQIRNSSTTFMTATSAGNIGIGTTNPSAGLNVGTGSGSSTGAVIGANGILAKGGLEVDGSLYNYAQKSTSGSVTVCIDSIGMIKKSLTACSGAY